MIRSISTLVVAALLFSSCDKNNSTRTQVAQETYTLPGDTLFPEGIAYNPTTGNFFTGSSTSGDIYKVNVQTGATNLFAPGASQGRKVATGMKIDNKNRLWVCGGAEGKIYVINLANGGLIKSWDVRTLFGAGFINDCIIDSNYVYFTDSQVQKIYRIRVTDDTPGDVQTWLTYTNAQIPFTASGTNANGIENTPDSKYLLIIISSSGRLYRIEKATQAIREVDLNNGLTAGDGLSLDGSFLYTSRNSTNQIWPARFNADYTTAMVGNPFGSGLVFPTTIVKVDNYLLAVNGQLNRRTTPPTPVLPFSVSRVTIP